MAGDCVWGGDGRDGSLGIRSVVVQLANSVNRIYNNGFNHMFLAFMV
jgi:hypothetical protein